MSWAPFGAPHPAPAARHTAALTNTPEGPLMVQFGARNLLVWQWTGMAWRLQRRLLTRQEGYPWKDGRPNCGSLVAYYDEVAQTPLVGYVERSGAVTLSPPDGAEPIVIVDSRQYGGETVAVFDPATRRPLLSDGLHTSVVHDDGTVRLHTADIYPLGTLAADPSASRVIGLDRDVVTYAWTGEGWWELAAAPGGIPSSAAHSTLAYCPVRKRVLCLFEDAKGEAMELRALDGDRWVTVAPPVGLPAVRNDALLGVGVGGSLVLYGGADDGMTAQSWVSDGDGDFRRVEAAMELPLGRDLSPVELAGRIGVVRHDDMSIRLLDADRLGGWARPPVHDGVRLDGCDANVVADRTGLWLLDGEGTLWHDEHRGDSQAADATSSETSGEAFDQRFRLLAPADGGPGPREAGRAAMVSDPDGDRLVLIGGDRRRTTGLGRGITAAARRNDTWVFTAGHGRWQRMETQGTPPDQDGAAAATPDGIYLFVSGELWRLAGAEWSCVAAAPEGFGDDLEHWLWYDARRRTLLAASLGASAAGTVWAVAGGQFRRVAEVPREATAAVLNRTGFLALDSAEDRLVIVLSGEQHLALPLRPVLAGFDPAEMTLPVTPVDRPAPAASDAPATSAGATRPAVLDPPLGHREWTELRRRMSQLSEQYLGPDLAYRLVRSEVLLSHESGTSTDGRARRGTMLGGNPRLDPGTPWPSSEDRPLSLLAVVDCAELATVGVHELLPHDGYLNVFYDPEADPADYAFPAADHVVVDTALEYGWRVIHASADAIEIEPPDTATVYPEKVMCRTHTLPWTGFYDFDLPDDVQDRVNNLQNVWEELGAPESPSGYPTGDREPMHIVGGWPIHLQNPVWETPDWRLLIQLDTDDELGWCWGDAGRLFFGITERDLEARNFDRVWVMSESH